jgi:DNA gyrase subunit A
MDIEDLIPVENMVVTITQDGYIKRVALDTYKGQRRGGVGLIGMETKEEDYVTDLFVTSTHDYLMFFTNHGRVYWLKTYQLPVGGRHAKGKPIVNLLPRLEEGEMVKETITVSDFEDSSFLVFATRNGIIKKTPLSAYSNVRKTGIIALNLDEDDELVETKLTDGDNEIILATRWGQAVRFDEAKVRSMGRPARGVRGIRLSEDDVVVSMAAVKPDSTLLTITKNGFGKLSKVEDYRKTNRGGKGVITIKTTERNGPVVAVKEVADGDELIITSQNGMIIRVPAEQIRLTGRAAQGVTIMKLRESDTICAVARLVLDDEEMRESREDPEADVHIALDSGCENEE